MPARAFRVVPCGLVRFLVLFLAFGCAQSQTVLSVDASAPVPGPLQDTLKLGSAVAPDGQRIGANARYLTRDGKPWLPVMGEYHFSRSPATQWEADLRKMKAAGVDVVATYVIWNHHEPEDGRFDWQGSRDLGRFARLARQAGLGLLVRIGPWVHAETRFGGLPDWVVDLVPTRRNDPDYLRYVARFYDQIGRQLAGQMWKDGGPVLGVQLENEYNLGGPGEGAEHILALKRLALAAGLDAPLYTVTGWDQALYPSGEVLPVFGGYVDEPWSRSTQALPPKETYVFRFATRVSGDLGAQTRGKRHGSAETDVDRTPFLGAEYGAGLPFMYRRRTVVSPEDIASMVTVQLGSGVNLLGYYMFHGGRNPLAAPTLEENTAIGGYNDTPAINYDFQAPLGPDGQERPVLGYLRPFHLFLHDFGERLAPMTVRKPDVVPDKPDDLGTPRWSVRSLGDSAFLFVNNYLRQYPLPDLKQVRYSLKLPGRTVLLPSRPVNVRSGAYFIWPIDFDLDGVRLAYATAQPLVRLDEGEGGSTYVFAATPDMPVELAFAAQPGLRIRGAGNIEGREDGTTLVRVPRPGLDASVELQLGARHVRLLVLDAGQARMLSTGTIAGKRRLVLSQDQLWFDDQGLQLRSQNGPTLSFAVYPAPGRRPAGANWTQAGDGLFQRYSVSLAPVSPRVEARVLRPARNAPPVPTGGRGQAALQPYPEAFRQAGAWTLRVQAPAAPQVEHYLLRPDLVGDVARLFDGTRMVDDWYYSGYGWDHTLGAAADGVLTLQVLPLRADAPIYLPAQARPAFGGKAQAAELRGVAVVPVYQARAVF